MAQGGRQIINSTASLAQGQGVKPIEPIIIPKNIFGEEKNLEKELNVEVVHSKPSLAKRAFYRMARPVYLVYSGIKNGFKKMRSFLHLQPSVEHGHH